MRVDIERVFALQHERAEINRVPLDTIEWHKDGLKLDIPQDVVEDFTYLGLNNTDFITSKYYTGKSDTITCLQSVSTSKQEVELSTCFKTGDKGQRFEISVYDDNLHERMIVGWCDTREGANALAEGFELRPSWSDGRVLDRGVI